MASRHGPQGAQRLRTGSGAAAPSLSDTGANIVDDDCGREVDMRRWRAFVLAALAAALPLLSGELHGWLLAMLTVAAGSVAALALASKKDGFLNKIHI